MRKQQLGVLVVSCALLGSTVACFGEETSQERAPVSSEPTASAPEQSANAGIPSPEGSPQEGEAFKASSGFSPKAIVGSIVGGILGVGSLVGLGVYGYKHRQEIKDEGIGPFAKKTVSNIGASSKKALLGVTNPALSHAKELDKEWKQKLAEEPRLELNGVDFETTSAFDTLYGWYEDKDDNSMFDDIVGFVPNSVSDSIKRYALKLRLNALGISRFFTGKKYETTYIRVVQFNTKNATWGAGELEKMVLGVVPLFSKVDINEDFYPFLQEWEKDQTSVEKFAAVISYLIELKGSRNPFLSIRIGNNPPRPFSVWKDEKVWLQNIFITLYCLEQIGAIGMVPPL